jgi:cobalamin biosynthetic protein CobC
MAGKERDHGGGLDAAAAKFGGARGDWLDISTGINPESYPITNLDLTPNDWTALPDRGADTALCNAARRFWRVPVQADVLAVPGCSAAIAQIPALQTAGQVEIALRSYNEHAAAFRFHGWDVQEYPPAPLARVVVHPNNPTGIFQPQIPPAPLTVIDESFCDIAPAQSHIAQAKQPGHIILKSFGKFWGLAGLRLGFAIGDPELIDALRQRLGPWPVSGIALKIGAAALIDTTWAEQTQARLTADSERLDLLMRRKSARPMGACPLFRTYEVADAEQLHHHLAKRKIWTRVFPYSQTWIRLGLPPQGQWERLEATL